MKNNKGFTIVELVISIFILAVAAVGVYSAFSVMVVLTSGSSDRLVASYLAQEGMEIVRNIRDTNWINSDIKTNWNDGLIGCNNDVKGCDYEAEYTTVANESPGVSSHPLDVYSVGRPLNTDARGFYTYSTIDTKPTKFIRKITIKQNTLPSTLKAPNVVNVSVTVSWPGKPNIFDSVGLTHSVTVEEDLYDWYSKDSVVITTSVEGNGTITPNGPVRVYVGSNRTFVFAPGENWEIGYVFIDGENKGAVSTYTFNDITNIEHSILVEFIKSEK